MKFVYILFILLLAFCAIAQDDHGHDDHDDHATTPDLTVPQIWGFGFLGGLAVSLIGFVAALIVVGLKRCCSDTFFDVFIKFLFALGCGALIGDAIVHMLPEAFASSEVNNPIGALIVLLAILFFLVLERLF